MIMSRFSDKSYSQSHILSKFKIKTQNTICKVITDIILNLIRF